jgi:hypothetical protein
MQNLYNSKVIPEGSLGVPYDCETSRLPHFIKSWLTDGGEVFSIMRRPAALYRQEVSWYTFLLEAECAIARLERSGQMKNPMTSSGIDLMTVPKLTALVANISIFRHFNSRLGN